MLLACSLFLLLLIIPRFTHQYGPTTAMARPYTVGTAPAGTSWFEGISATIRDHR